MPQSMHSTSISGNNLESLLGMDKSRFPNTNLTPQSQSQSQSQSQPQSIPIITSNFNNFLNNKSCNDINFDPNIEYHLQLQSQPPVNSTINNECCSQVCNDIISPTYQLIQSNNKEITKKYVNNMLIDFQNENNIPSSMINFQSIEIRNEKKLLLEAFQAVNSIIIDKSLPYSFSFRLVKFTIMRGLEVMLSGHSYLLEEKFPDLSSDYLIKTKLANALIYSTKKFILQWIGINKINQQNSTDFISAWNVQKILEKDGRFDDYDESIVFPILIKTACIYGLMIWYKVESVQLSMFIGKKM